MTPDAPLATLDELLAHRHWVRMLAQSLLADPHRADDIEQQVWVAALERPPRRTGNLRAWLAGVARRRRVDLLRRETRRRDREAALPPRESPPSPEVLVSRAETQARVVQAVLALEEPYRSTVLLRFFEGLSAREVARTTGVPEETVRTRIGRALVQLRGRLARELGPENGGWRRALLPVAGLDAVPLAASGTGALTLTARGLLAAAGLLLALLGVGVLLDDLPGEPAALPQPDAASRTFAARRQNGEPVPPSLRGARGAATGRTSLRASAEPAGRVRGGADEDAAPPDGVRRGDPVPRGVVAGTAPGVSISGRVVEVGSETPAAGVLLLAVEGAGGVGVRTVTARSAEDGSFVLAGLSAGSWTLTAGSRAAPSEGGADAYVPTDVGPVEAGTAHLRIEVRRGYVLEGTVRGPDAKPWTSGALVRASPVDAAGSVDYAGQRHARTAADGSFRLAGLVRGRYDLTVVPDSESDTASTCGAVHLRGVAAGTTGLVVDLVAGRPLTGRLVDEAGEAVTGEGQVWVSPHGKPPGAPGSVAATLLEHGRFETPPLDEGRAWDVKAVGFAGHGSARLWGVTVGSEEILVVLPRGLSISGRVLDADDHPAPQGVPVLAVVEGRTFEPTSRPPWAYGWALTDTEGRFRLNGLERLPYTVRAGGATSGYLGLEARSGVVAPAEDVTLRVERGVSFRGRLLDARGHGVAFATLFANGGTGGSWVPQTQTREDGRFSFAGVFPGTIRIHARIQDVYVPIGAFEAPADGVTLTLPE